MLDYIEATGLRGTRPLMPLAEYLEVDRLDASVYIKEAAINGLCPACLVTVAAGFAPDGCCRQQLPAPCPGCGIVQSAHYLIRRGGKVIGAERPTCGDCFGGDD